MNLEQYYNYLIESGIVTSEETLEVATFINGYNEDTLNDVLYAKSGYRNIEQYLEYEDEETYEEYYGASEEDED